MSDPSRPYEPPVTKEVSVLDGLLVLARHKGLILGTMLVLGVLGVVVALLMPPEYTSSAVLYGSPPRRSPAAAAWRPSAAWLSVGGAEPGLTAEAYPAF